MAGYDTAPCDGWCSDARVNVAAAGSGVASRDGWRPDPARCQAQSERNERDEMLESHG